MKLRGVKSLPCEHLNKKTYKITSMEKNHKKSSLDLNYEIDFTNRKNYLKENRKDLPKKELIVVGLNWKFVKATDIFSILKPFECYTGDIKSVSILSYKPKKQQKLIHKARPQFNSIFEKQFKKKVCIDEKNIKIFAKIDCDSGRTLKNLYKKCNGLEIGNKCEIMDIRVIKSNLSQNSSIIEFANKIPKNYFPTYLTSQSISKKKIKINTENSTNRRQSSDSTIGINNSQLSRKITVKVNYQLKEFHSPVFYIFSNLKYSILSKNRIFQTGKKFLFRKLAATIKI